MPRIKVALRRGFQGSQHIRGGITVLKGEPQTFDVSDEALQLILDDPAFDVDERDIEETPAETAQTGGEGDESGEDSSDGAGSDETAENDAEETDEATDEELGDETPAGEGDDSSDETTDDENDSEGDETDEASADDFPTTVSAIKKLNRDVVVAKAQELKLEGLNYEEGGSTKAQIAEAIVASQQG